MTLEERLLAVRGIVSVVDGVLTDGRLTFDGEGRLFQQFNVRDGLGLALWRLVGGKFAVVSLFESEAIHALTKQWRCAVCHTGVHGEAEVFQRVAHDLSLAPSAIAFLGADVFDLPAMSLAGCAVAPADAPAVVRGAAHWVSDCPGGGGVVRAFVQEMLRTQARYDEAVREYLARADGGQ